MNRTLRRPMFRMGGSAEGITSGLQAPRQGYATNEDNLVKENDLSKIDLRNMNMQQLKDLASQMSYRPKGTNINDFLISMGLDLVSRPTSGNIFSDLATSSKEPFAQMQAAKASRASDQDKLSQALIGDIMEQMSDEEIARIKAKGEQGKGKQFEYKGKYDDYQALLTKQRELEDQQTKLQQEKEAMPDNIDSAIIDNQIEQVGKQIEDNARLQGLFQDKEEDAVRAAILKGISNGIFTFEDLIVYDETGVPPREDNADGGRIGYQQGNMVQPNAMPAAMPMDQGPTQDSTVQDLSFEELRSRLPESITNDVVTLIANSQQALVEFANLQTQQDVKEFNRKYEVNLVLPQEA